MEQIKNKFLLFTQATINLAFWILLGAFVGYYSSFLGEQSVGTINPQQLTQLQMISIPTVLVLSGILNALCQYLQFTIPQQISVCGSLNLVSFCLLFQQGFCMKKQCSSFQQLVSISASLTIGALFFAITRSFQTTKFGYEPLGRKYLKSLIGENVSRFNV